MYPSMTGNAVPPRHTLIQDRDASAACRKGWVAASLLALLASCTDLTTAKGPSYGFLTTPGGDCKVTVWIKAYINPWATAGGWIKTILPPSDHADSLAVVLNPFVPGAGSPDRYLTDNRGNSSSITASSRMHSQAVFAAPQIGHPKLFGTPTHSTGWTVGIDRDDLATPPTDTDVCTAQAPETYMSWNSARHAGDSLWIDLSASGGNPCPPAYSPPPWSIDYQGTLKLMNMGSHLHVAFAGQVDGYPSYEMYASDGQTFDVIFQQPNWGNHPGYLSGGADVPVSGNAKLCWWHTQGRGHGQ